MGLNCQGNLTILCHNNKPFLSWPPKILPLESISYDNNTITIQYPDLSSSLKKSGCRNLYFNFSIPVKLYVGLYESLNSSLSSVRCDPDHIQSLPKIFGTDYNLSYWPSLGEDKPPQNCSTPDNSLDPSFESIFSFENDNSQLTLLSASYSDDLVARPGCFANWTEVPDHEDRNSTEVFAREDVKGGNSRYLIFIIIIVCFLGFVLFRQYAEPNISQEENMLTTNNETLDLWSTERSSDFPLFDFNQIANATGNFSLDNKLGEGGFGPVYKGVLQDGLEIAVKRLSSYSGQGLVEFKNEIQLIAKLQHKNLVRLVGWCMQGEEKILIYEFMPNKSLDYFILDKTRGALLNWERRFEIIKGIAQGLLYLHQHSRLRIIHRDLKASNILLDSEMNPKISDFGLARIFGPKELQANTNRVVGTYGYMAPEYASEGLFSIKSDVFSFGVLLLEIVSGKRNTGFHQYGKFLNLLGYAWDRWKGGNIPELICPTLTEVSQRQAERFIHVGLLCVQENPSDRPIMSDVSVFLTTESIILPEPKQPAYFNLRVTEEAVDPFNFNGSACSINYVSFTNPELKLRQLVSYLCSGFFGNLLTHFLEKKISDSLATQLEARRRTEQAIERRKAEIAAFRKESYAAALASALKEEGDRTN
ncbi:G-type lectin S-receptor-like serine/threonine-protein kinase [Carex littledalei]|uniref:non-specific serine/threonine protein kinase n=1 Tax=Carex littledalei TaxID=544730 RepID=A0A833VXG6_9POAL|nr:G-type lectin S-receptor-like serine/threonine-protein kinase [Carex littledalei]